MKTVKIAISVFFMLLLVGCGRVQPIMNIEDEPVAYELHTQQVKTAIIEAATRRGWVITQVTNDKLTARINVRSHSATIDIPFSSKYYSLLHVSSTNLNEDDGNIHRNYNKWINTLDLDIKRKFSTLVVSQ